MLGSIILWDDLAFDNPNIAQQYRDESWALYMNRYELSTPETFTTIDWDLWMHNTPAVRAVMGIHIPNSMAGLVTDATSEAHLVELHAAWVESQMGLVQPVLDELNALR